MKQAERICGRYYFCFWWICTSIIPLLAFLGALNLCKAIMVCMYLVLNKAPSQQLREGRRSFPSNSILVCISSTSTLYLFLHFLSRSCLEISFRLTHNLKSTKGGPLFTTKVCVNLYGDGLLCRDSKGCPTGRFWTWLPLSLPLICQT